jgi:hypothetical protein
LEIPRSERTGWVPSLAAVVVEAIAYSMPRAAQPFA